jgi:hypothetical protein
MKANDDSSISERGQPSKGEVLCGRFEIDGSIGEPGTMGYALIAYDRLVEEKVVCKFCHAHVDEPLKSLLAQYKVLGGMLSADIVRPRGIFLHTVEPARPFLVLEFIDGPPLSAWAERANLRERLNALWHVAMLLSELEAKGIQHGDLHEANILCPPGRFVLIDPLAAEYGYSQGRKRQRGSKESKGLSDITAWSIMAHDLLTSNSDLLQHLNEQIFNKSNPGIQARVVAHVLERILTGTWLSDDGGNEIQDIADEYRYRRDESVRVYSNIRSARTAVIAGLAGEIANLGRPLDIVSDGVVSSERDYLKIEAASDARPKGRFYNRHVSFRTREDDELLLRFQGVDWFRKPWPYSEIGLVSQGDVLVNYDDATVVQEILSLRWVDGVAKIFVDELGGVQLYDDKRIKRLLRILAGQTIPGMMSPKRLSGLKRPLGEWRERLSETPGGGSVPSVQAQEMNSEELLKQHIEGSLQAGVRELSAETDAFRWLLKMFEATSPKMQRQILADVVERGVIKEYGAYIDALYRFDVSDISPGTRSFNVVVDLAPSEGKRIAWQFRVSRRKT